MISNLDSHHEAWSSTLSDLKICPTENVKVATHRLENIAGFLNPNMRTNLDALLSEDVVLQGLNIFIRNTLKERILAAVEEVGEAGNETSQKDEDLINLIKAFFATVTNFTSHEKSAESFLKFEGMIEDFKPLWLESKYKHIFPLSVKSLYNFSAEDAARKILIEKCPSVVKDSVRLLNSLVEDPEKIEPFATFVANMTTMREARRLLLDPNDYEMFEDLFKLLEPSQPVNVRRAASRIIKHLTADPVGHAYLLGDTVNILPHILLPLAGNEQFDDDEYAPMPIELQYLEASKTRDEDMEVRENLLAALLQLSRLKSCREQIRNANAYYILRELHKFETQESLIDLVERVVDLLIRTEEEIGEKGDFVDYPVPSLEDWISGKWKHPDDSEMQE